MDSKRIAVCLSALVLAFCHEKAVIRPSGPPIVIGPDLPADVPGGAQQADLPTASRFAWQQFIALNWPARAGMRDTADLGKPFGQPGPVVWQTLRSKVEIYPGDGSETVGPHGADKGPPSYGYDEPPLYVYSATNRPGGLVPPCAGQTPVSTPAWVNLDEISQVGFDHLWSGGQLVRYTSKGNRTNYNYIVANRFWYDSAGSPYKTAAKNFYNAVATNTFPPAKPFVTFPVGAIEVKAAFRPLTATESASGRFFTSVVRYYDGNPSGQPCYHEAVWGLIGLHVVQKTPTAPAFTWATFEQADTLAGEDADGAVTKPSSNPNNPALQYQDGNFVENKAPLVSRVNNAPFCTDTAGLSYREIPVTTTDGQTYANIPVGGNICINARMRTIPPSVVDANREAHRAIGDYEQAHHLQPSPWRYYKLVNIQTYPFDKSKIDKNDDSPHGAPTFYTANSVIESDYTLQNHSGGPETKTGFAPSDLPANFAACCPQPAAPTYQNTYILTTDGKYVTRYNMGGCTGCHGLTQIIAGSDYSYLLSGSSVSDPEFPETPEKTLTTKYNRFAAAAH